MFYETNTSVLYSDTLIPDVFISDYLPSLDGDSVKIYIFIQYLGKHNKSANLTEISKTLSIEIERVKDSLQLLENYGIIEKKDKKTLLVDLKEKEIKKLFRRKTTSLPEEAIENSEKNKRRNATVYAINEKFFQGLMSPTWYTDIDTWFERYKFDEDVMYTLFQHCFDHRGFSKNYIEKVAENWFNKNIKTSLDLDTYYIENQKLREIRNKIAKKLKLGRMLTEYEEELVENWYSNYNYEFDIIEIVLKRTTGKTSPNFNYINSVLTDWNSKGLKTKEEIMEYTKILQSKTSNENRRVADSKVPQYANFEQREYSEEYYEKFYENLKE
jgi:DnaD/phage-associated family protein